MNMKNCFDMKWSSEVKFDFWSWKFHGNLLVGTEIGKGFFTRASSARCIESVYFERKRVKNNRPPARATWDDFMFDKLFSRLAKLSSLTGNVHHTEI